MSRQVDIMLGAPGCGKTTACLNIIDEEIKRGTDPERIAFVSFSRKAAGEAMERGMKRFGLKEDRFPHFRTLHSTAYRALGLKPGQVMSGENWTEFASMGGYEFKERYDEDDEIMKEVPKKLGNASADLFLSIHHLSKASQISLEEAYMKTDCITTRLQDVRNFSTKLEQYKKWKGVVDFSDMIEMCDHTLPVDVFILDEAQDCSPAQWSFARRLARNARRVVLAGDDDQSIYGFAGADGSRLSSFAGNRVVLPKSYRMSKRVKEYADRVAATIRNRIPKAFEHSGEEGEVQRLFRADKHTLDLRNGETWLLLARCGFQLAALTRLAQDQGVVYQKQSGRWSNSDRHVRAALIYERLRRGEEVTVEDARVMSSFIRGMERPTGTVPMKWDDFRWGFEGKPDWMTGLNLLKPEQHTYIRDLRAHGEPLKGPGRVRISTIHAAKGGEADNVLLLTDLPEQSRRAARFDPDAENRVLYVGVSRARKRLFLHRSGGGYYWKI